MRKPLFLGRKKEEEASSEPDLEIGVNIKYGKGYFQRVPLLAVESTL